MALGALLGALLARFIAPSLQRFFHEPTGGVGFTTVNHYPKSWDYATIALLVALAMLGAIVAAIFSRGSEPPEQSRVSHSKPLPWILAALVFATMFFIHDHPYQPLDPFHDGEHLTPGFLYKSGERPYRDVSQLHGLATDGGIDALVLGDPPSPRHVRRTQTFLNALALALLVPIAAAICETSLGIVAAVLASLCAVAGGQITVFPFFRWIPLLLAVWAMLVHLRNGTRRSLFAALAISMLGLLWSLDTGVYAVVATIGVIVLMRVAWPRDDRTSVGMTVAMIAAAALLPIIVLVVLRADLQRFIVDSFVRIPAASDAIAALPAPPLPTWRDGIKWLASESARYYLPPIFYALLLALSVREWARNNRPLAGRMLVIAIYSLLLFRTASGRSGWSHTRFSLPLLGIGIVAFLIEPLLRKPRRPLHIAAAIIATLVLIPYLELVPNVVTGAKYLVQWKSRQSHAGQVPYPFATGKGIYTSQQDADELAALNGFIASVSSPRSTILDLSNERTLYYLLERKPAVRCPDVGMLSHPPMLAEALQELNAAPPSSVIAEGLPILDQFDGVPNKVRVPQLFAWVDEHYPRRTRVGRFVVATSASPLMNGTSGLK